MPKYRCQIRKDRRLLIYLLIRVFDILFRDSGCKILDTGMADTPNEGLHDRYVRVIQQCASCIRHLAQSTLALASHEQAKSFRWLHRNQCAHHQQLPSHGDLPYRHPE